MNCGRRTGKTTLLIDLLTDEVGLSYPCAYFAPTYKGVEEVWRSINRITSDLIVRRDVQQHRLEYATGGVLDMWSLDKPNTLRGRKYKRVAIDEAAQIRELEQAWNEVIRPTLADLRGEANFGSTPFGLNYFHTLFQRGQDPKYPDWASWHLPTSANPYIPKDELEALRLDMPERRYAQEIGALFLSSEGAVFRRVREAMTATPQDQAIEGHTYVIGVDWARSYDFTVVTVIDATTKEQVLIDRFNQVDYGIQKGRLKGIAARFPRQPIIAERNSIGDPLISDLQRDGVPIRGVDTTNASKALWVDALALALEQGTLRILPDETQAGELVAYEGVELPSKLIRYSAPDGMHDDMVMALMIAWQQCAKSGVSVTWL